MEFERVLLVFLGVMMDKLLNLCTITEPARSRFDPLESASLRCKGFI